MYQHVYECIKNLIVDLCDIEENEINRKSKFDQFDFESLDFIELQVVVKRNFGVPISVDLFVNGLVKDIDDLCDYICKHSEAIN